jgi:EAL domain-containing protein (putative c-di-GMP-specific phosphodiesterase class I)
MGIRVAIDDFGTGYSSLAYLKRLSVNAIKIDRTFIKDMVINHDDHEIVRSTIDLAHNLKLSVVAEGVETKEMWDQLVALGCDVAQGYYMRSPIPAAEVPSWLKESSWGPQKKDAA